MSQSNPKVSVIVPCYETASSLPRCLDSLLAQTLSDIEIICVNDGSSDGTPSVLRAYEREHPGKIRVLDKRNEGAWRARWDGIQLARGAYIGFLDSDDYVEPCFCASLCNRAIETGADITVCGFQRVDEDTGEILSTEMSEARPTFSATENPSLLLQLNGAPWNKLFRAELLKRMPDLSPSPRLYEDIMMLLLVYPFTDIVSFTGGSPVRYMVHQGSIMTSIDEGRIDSVYRCMLEVRKYYRGIKASPTLMDLLDSEAFVHLGVSLMFYLSCDPKASMRPAFSRNKEYLDAHFPRWRCSRALSLGSALGQGGALLKAHVCRSAYKANLLPALLSAYRIIIQTLHIEIKW